MILPTLILPTHHPRDFRLDDGRSVRIRPLRATDRATYAWAVYSLSPRSRYLRFFTPIEKLSERMLDQMTQVDGHRHVAWLALTLTKAPAWVWSGTYVLPTTTNRLKSRSQSPTTGRAVASAASF
jgi:hypothetical protein